MAQQFSTNKDWKTPRLIARLEERSGPLSSAWNPAAVTGRTPAMEKIARAVTFAYMGNSEFEFGTTRNAADHLQAYIDRNKVAPFIASVTIGLREPVDVYGLAPRKFHGPARQFLSSSDHWRTAEPTYFTDVMTGNADHVFSERTKGWFDLENQVLFFADRDTCEKVRVALGVKTPIPAPAALIPGQSEPIWPSTAPVVF